MRDKIAALSQKDEDRAEWGSVAFDIQIEDEKRKIKKRLEYKGPVAPLTEKVLVEAIKSMKGD